MNAVFASILTAYAIRRFRWVYCQIETLRRCFPASIRRTLDELPETLDGTYEQTLQSIDKQKRDYAYRLFQCLVVSKRPLRVEELAELFSIHWQPNAENLPTFDPNLRPENPEEFILSACSTLVTVLEVHRRGPFGEHIGSEKIVQFSHFSVREYLISDRIAISEHVSRFHILPRLAHALFARACLSLLLQLDVHVEDYHFWYRIQNFPLADYAAEHWVGHAQFDNVASEIQRGMECLFDKDKPHFAVWQRIYDVDKKTRYPYFIFPPYERRPYLNPLYYAALCGFRDITDHLANTHPKDVNTRSGHLVTPLHAALDMGHLSTAMLLLRRGADIKSRDLAGRTPLHIVLYRGHVEIVSSLLKCGANPNAKSDKGETPLYLASKAGMHDTVKLLLEHRAKSNYPDVHGSTPLYVASLRGHDHVVRLLLDHGADVNHPNNWGRTPQHVAWDMDHDNIVRLLLNHGADANQRRTRGGSSLHLALKKGHNDIVRLLLNNGADPNYPDYRGKSPLHVVLQWGHRLDIVMLLLEHGADANRPDNCGETPLNIALQEGDNDIIRLLLDHGADANHPDNYGETSLHIALRQGNDDVVRLLLDHGADANHPNSDGWTALHAASQEGHDDIVRLLIDHGADANRSDNDGWSPLHAASQGGHGTVVLLLLNHGAVADHPNNDGWTPLHAASQEGHDYIVRLLLDHGAAPNHQDNRGRTPLHVARRKSNRHHTSPYLLLRPDAGAIWPGSDDWTPPRRVPKGGNNDIDQLLLKLGADANQPNSDGLTPRHLALRAAVATTRTSYYSVMARMDRTTRIDCKNSLALVLHLESHNRERH